MRIVCGECGRRDAVRYFWGVSVSGTLPDLVRAPMGAGQEWSCDAFRVSWWRVLGPRPCESCAVLFRFDVDAQHPTAVCMWRSVAYPEQFTVACFLWGHFFFSVH